MSSARNVACRAESEIIAERIVVMINLLTRRKVHRYSAPLLTRIPPVDGGRLLRSAPCEIPAIHSSRLNLDLYTIHYQQPMQIPSYTPEAHAVCSGHITPQAPQLPLSHNHIDAGRTAPRAAHGQAGSENSGGTAGWHSPP